MIVAQDGIGHPGIDPDGSGSGGESELNASWLRRHGIAIFLGLLAVFAGVIILVEAGPAGLVGFSPQSHPPAAIAASQSTFEGIVRQIYGVANQAVHDRRADLLSQAYSPNCQCYTQVKATIDQLLAHHDTLSGTGMEVVSVEVELVKPSVAILRVTDKIDPYAEYTEGGTLLSTFPGRQPLQFTVTLEQRDGRWLMSDAVPAANALP